MLEFLVEETLQGRGDQLKGYTIGVDVFDKAENFDPAQDSLVRVQMARLRGLLGEYYDASGRNERQRIVLEKGNYAPRLETVTPEAAGQALVAVDPAPQTSGPKPKRGRLRVGLVLALLAITGLAVWLQWSRGSTDPVEQAAQLPDSAKVYVATFDLSGGTEISESLRDGLQYDLIGFLSQLPHIGVFGYETVAGQAAAPDYYGADFLLRGSIAASGDKLRVSSSLVRLRDGVIIWSQVTDPIAVEPGDLLKVQSEIALSVASELGQTYGVINEAMRNDLENYQGVTMTNYLCELHAYEYMREKSSAELDDVRACLERAVKQSPNHSDAWALLSWIYGDDGRQARPGKSRDAAMQRALVTARQAVRANATNAVGYQYLAIAQFYTGNDEAALVSIGTALRLAPNNSEILANAGWLLAAIENNPEAAALSEKAIQLNPGHPAWYWLGLTLSAFQSGDFKGALRFAKLLDVDRSPLSDYLLAAAFQANGMDAHAAATLDRLARQFPEAAADPEDMWKLYRLRGKVRDLVREAVAASNRRKAGDQG